MLCSTFFPSDLTATNELKENIAQQHVHGREEGKQRAMWPKLGFYYLIFIIAGKL